MTDPFFISGLLEDSGCFFKRALAGSLGRGHDARMIEIAATALCPPAHVESHPEDSRALALIACMTREEKVAQLTGFGVDGDMFGGFKAEQFGTPGLERLGIPPLIMGHAITGVRSGRISTVKGTYFCTPAAVAATWDPDLYGRIGGAMALEMRALGQDLNLGPTLNIIRHPLGGRNWESYSEDPHLVARLAVAFVRAQQANGLICGPKHFAANNQEHERFDINNVVDERTLREIYLPAFEAAVREGGALNIMAAYNRLNGTYICENTDLLRGILRDEWGFEGFVVSDFCLAMQSTEGSVRAGVNIEMDSPKHYGEKLLAALEDGRVAEADVDGLLLEKFRVMIRMGLLDGKPRPAASVVRSHGHLELAQEVARRSPVLLKNEGDMLPLDRSALKSLAVIGPNASRPPLFDVEKPDYAHYLQGGGSGRSYYVREALVEPLQGLRQLAGAQVEVRHARGAPPAGGSRKADLAAEQALRDEAVALARASDAAVLVMGLTGLVESEGFDRPSARLPAAQEALIREVLAVQPRTVVVLVAGCYIEAAEWIDVAPAVVYAPYAGERIGLGLAELLWGDQNFTGRLPISYPLRADDYPPGSIYSGGPHSVTGDSNAYSEGMFVGYRYFDTQRKPLLFPFGHGLSYTRFDYGPLDVRTECRSGKVSVEAELEIANAGPREGVEVVQLYVAAPDASTSRPRRELRAFACVELEAGASRRVRLALDGRAFSQYVVEEGRWAVDPGSYHIEVGASSRDIRQSVYIELGGVPASPSEKE